MTEQSYFEFHEPKQDPIAVAVVNCNPKTDNELATFYCKQNDEIVNSRPPEKDKKDDWKVIVPFGHYDFIAEIEMRKGQKINELIWPPCQYIKIEVAP